MKFTFGHNGSCFWLLISTPEILTAALDKFLFVNGDEDHYLSLLEKGNTIFLNRAGGYHYGEVEGYMTNLTEGTEFPLELVEA